MADPLSYLEEVLADAETFLQEGQTKESSDHTVNERVADFLDKVAEAIEKEDQFDDDSIAMFVGENTNDNTLKLRESVKNRIQQLGSMGIPS